MNPRDVLLIGNIPEHATHFGVRRKRNNEWERLDVAEGAERVRDFPIRLLSRQWIRRNFGPGTYRILFLMLSGGARQVRGNGRIFQLTPRKGDPVHRTSPTSVSLARATLDTIFPFIEHAVLALPEEVTQPIVDAAVSFLREAEAQHGVQAQGLLQAVQMVKSGAPEVMKAFRPIALPFARQALDVVAASPAQWQAVGQPFLELLVAGLAAANAKHVQTLEARVSALEAASKAIA